MGLIADRVMQMMAEGRRSADIVTEIAKMEDRAVKLLAVVEVAASEFDQFWAEYPHKTGKPDAMKAFRKVRQGSALSEIMVGLRRYVQTKPTDRPWLNPATFLRQERYRDQPAAVAQANGLAAAREKLRREIEDEQDRDQHQEDFDPRYAGGLPGISGY
jgi:hypothetical protein